LGFRWFDWNYQDNRLYLNGEKIHIHGSNRHQEYPWLGDALPKWMHQMDLQDIRFNLGFNFMRTCHYNQDPVVYDLTDQYGILICEEVPNIKNIEFGKDIQEQHVKEMIRRDRNHPSIIMWSMGNETNHAAEPRWAYEEDPTRILHCRHCAGVGEDLPHTHQQMPMESLLRCTIRGWYNADVKPFEPPNHQHAGHDEWQHDQALSQGGERPLAVNGSKWIYADHGCDREYFNSPLKHVNPKGWVDSYRMPKYFYYLWAANWSEQPVMFIHPYDWSSRYLGQNRTITVNSNCEEVVLKVNGTIVGREKPIEANDYTVVFKDVPIRQGTIRAEGVRNGEQVVHEVAMAGEPAKLVVSCSHSQIPADRAGISLIKVDIVDQHGHYVYGATNELNFQISGPGKLVGPQHYESDIHKNGEFDGTLYIDTPVAVPIRSTDRVGQITFTVTSAGLAPATITIDSVLPESDEVRGINEPTVCTVGVSHLITYTGNEKNKLHSIDSDQLEESIDDIDFRGIAEGLYADRVNRWICERNPQIDTETNAYTALIDLMVVQLIKDQGLTVADDYNFNIQQYNNCSQILSFIHSANWDLHAKQKMEKHYIDSVITRGVQVDVGEQVNILAADRPWQKLGISLVEFGCCLAIGSFMPQTDKTQGANLNAPEKIVNGIKQLLSNGYQFAELTVGALMQLSRDEFDEVKNRVRDAKLTVPVFNSFIPKELKLTGPEVDVRQIEKYVDQAMKRISALGGRQIIFGSGGARSVPAGFSMDQAMNQIKQFLRLCEMYAGHYRITVAIEPLNRKESNILNTVGEALELADELNLPHIKVLADAYHMNLESEPFTIMTKAIDRKLLSHVHISEYNRSFPLGEAGSEGIDFQAFFRELQQAGYDGAISAECSSTNFEENCIKSIGYVKQIWETVR
ncbi:MAG: glycoside hydrolase family 2 sugar binding protein, partial [Bacilli bacterium]|nr:glycoside hydrolase family 2 sugar binding protein [Bacilli bacterium]